MNVILRNKVSGVQGVFSRKVKHSTRGDVFVIKTNDGREYFGPAGEFECVNMLNLKTSHL